MGGIVTGRGDAQQRAVVLRLAQQAIRGARANAPAVVEDALARLDAIGGHVWDPVMAGWANVAIHALTKAVESRRPIPGSVPIVYEAGQWQLRFTDEHGQRLQPEAVASPLDLLTLRFIVAIGNGQVDTARALSATAIQSGEREPFIMTVLRQSVAIHTTAHP